MKLNGIIVALCSVGILNAHAENVAIAKSSLVGDGIVEFVPQGFDQTKTPSLILKEEPTAKGSVPSDWELYPQFTVVDGKANASLSLTGEISLYGGGEVTGPLLRNGQYIKLWNTDTGAYGVDGGKRLYQSHPWVLGVRRDGSAFGICSIVAGNRNYIPIPTKSNLTQKELYSAFTSSTGNHPKMSSKALPN